MIFNAYRLLKESGVSRGSLIKTTLDELDSGDLVVKTAYAGVNFKDALAATGRAPIIRRFPCIGGIEAVGEVVESGSDAYQPGDAVILHGRGLGVSHDGGFSEYVRVPADWAVPLPTGLNMQEAATLGVAGHTAAVAIDLMELNGLTPERGPVAVTGATGGVASLSIDMLSGLGYEVAAVSRKTESHSYLRSLGARQVISAPASDASARPLESAQWGGAVDAAGGHMLAWLLRTMAPKGTIACFGNAAGIELHTTVLPFILRGVRLLGVNADTEPGHRRRVWARIAGDLKPRHLAVIATSITLDELPRVCELMAEGRTTGRYVVRFD